MQTRNIRRRELVGAALSAPMLIGAAAAEAADAHAQPPAGFKSAKLRVNGTSLHYVRGGTGPTVILLHGFPEDWSEYRAIMPRLARRFTVLAIDLPGIGQSGAAAGGADAANLAAHIHGLAQALKLERPYLVGHDLGGIVTYAYVRSFPESLRGAMILDVPIPGVDGWDQAISELWHIRFIQAPGEIAEKLVTGRQGILFDNFLSVSKFTPAERAYYAKVYGAKQLHAGFEIYRAFPQDAEFNSARNEANSVPLLIAVGEKSFFNSHIDTFVAGYRARGMRDVESARIPDANHYVLADNPGAVATLIERAAGSAVRR